MSEAAKRRTLLLLAVALVLLAGLNVFQYLSKPALSDADVVDRFHHVWSDNKALFHSKWMGVPTIQNPLDVWITQEIIHEVKPDFIVEAGTYHGGSAVLWAMVLQQIRPGGRVITVDVEDKAEKARKLPIAQQHVDFLLGSSTDPRSSPTSRSAWPAGACS